MVYIAPSGGPFQASPPSMPTRVLLVEDAESDIFYIRQTLGVVAHNHSYDVTQVPSLLEAIRKLNTETFDVIVLDLNLLDINGMVTVTALRAEVPSIPIVVYSGLDDARLKERAIRCGAACYVVKGHEHELGLDYIIDNALTYGHVQARTANTNNKRASN